MSISEAEFTAIRDRMAANIAVITGIKSPPLPKSPTPKCGKAKRGANKWEQEFGEVLRQQQDALGLLVWYQFEALRFRLADGAYYKPDFVALTHTGTLIAYEVKGMWREAARVRIKVAADRHPFKFVAVRKKLVREGGGWSYEWFTSMYDRVTPIGDKA